VDQGRPQGIGTRLDQALVVGTWVVSIGPLASRSRSFGLFTLDGSSTGSVGLSGVALLP